MLIAKGSRVQLTLEGGRQVHPSGMLLHDESGRDFPAKRCLITTISKTSKPLRKTKWFGPVYTPLEGSMTIPGTRSELLKTANWKTVGEVKKIVYDRVGEHAERYQHSFTDKRPLLLQRGRVYCLVMRGGTKMTGEGSSRKASRSVVDARAFPAYLLEMADYLDIYDEAIGKAATTAAAPRQDKKRHDSLTGSHSRAEIVKARSSHPSPQRRTPLRSPREENVVKKRRSKAQKAATRKMIAANRRRSKGKRSKGKRRSHARENPILVTGKNLKSRKVGKRRKGTSHKKKRAKARKGGGGSSKRSRAAKKAARTRKANKAKRSLAAKKAARSRKRKHGKAHHGKRKAHAKKKSHSRKGKRSKASYSKAAKKAARTRKRNRTGGTPRVTKREREEYERGGYAYESRRKGKRRPKKNPIQNPIPLEGGLDFFSGLFAVVIGYLFAGGADRMGATHALTPSSAQGGYLDAPAVGQIYNSEAPATPIWSSGMRIAFNVIPIAVPMGLSAMIKSKGPKAFFQLMAFAAIARTLGKAAEDGMSMAMKTTSFGLRVYGPELAAQAKLTSAATTALPQAAPGTFAGAKPTAGGQLAGASEAQQPRIDHSAPVAPPMPTFAPVNRTVEGAPARTGGLDTSHHYVSGPAFNPFAPTDS